jgi:hypothetical protein
MGNRNAEVGDILLKHRSDALAIAQGKSNGKDIGTSAAEAKAALIAWKDAAVLEARLELMKQQRDDYEDTLRRNWIGFDKAVPKFWIEAELGVLDNDIAQLQAREEKRK